MTLPVYLAELAADRCRDGEATLVLITRSEGADFLTGTVDLVRSAGEGAARAAGPGLLAAVMVASDGTETAYAEPEQPPGWLAWDQLTDAEQRLILMGAYGPPERLPSGRPVSRDNWLALGGEIRPPAPPEGGHDDH